MKTEHNPSLIPVPFPNSYWVVPGRLLAGEYPDELDEHGTRQKIVRMLQLGVNVFVDLTNPGDSWVSYHNLLKDEAAELGVEVELHQHAIGDFDVPPPLEMKAILDKIDQAVAAEKTVYVHCLAGLGRTGTVVGCYLVRHGLEGETALRRLTELRQSTLTAHMPSPEGPKQEMMILEWRVGQ